MAIPPASRTQGPRIVRMDTPMNFDRNSSFGVVSFHRQPIMIVRLVMIQIDPNITPLTPSRGSVSQIITDMMIVDSVNATISNRFSGKSTPLPHAWGIMLFPGRIPSSRL